MAVLDAAGGTGLNRNHMRWADIAKAAFVLAAMLAGVQGGFYVADATGWPPGLTVAPLMVAALLLAIRVVRGKA